MNCPRCATPIPDGARFCPACGAPVTERPRSERRLVTVLFGDLSGFTALSENRDAEEVKALIDATFLAVGEIVERFGGHVDKVIGDEVMAVFGAPQAHEDDAARAVRAAMAILAELERRSESQSVRLQMHIGINTGEVVAGFVGGSDAYTVLGDAVNTARRIQEIATPGQILVGESTRIATHHEIEYRNVGRVQAKGKRLPVAVWEAEGERDLPGTRPRSAAPLVGREEELALLETALDLVRRDGKPMLVTIVGDAGLGKSRIVDEFTARTRARGTRVVIGRSLPYDTASPSAAVEEMVRGALVLDPDIDDPDIARAWISERLKPLGVGNADQVLSFLGLGDGPARGGQAALLRTAWVLLEERARAEGVLVLALHEMHWADVTVLQFAYELMNGDAPILAICLGRPELLDRLPDWKMRAGTIFLDLEPLPPARAEELLDTLAPDLHPAVRGSVLERAGGNPFFIEELARLMIGRPSGESLQVPSSVQALVTARIDQLGERQKRVLQDAAVVGTRFWGGALERLGSTDTAAVLGELLAGAWIEVEPESSVPGETEYRFRQSIVRDVAYASVPKQARATQHAMVGTWIEDVSASTSTPEDFYDLVAHHFDRAASLAAEVGTEVEGAIVKAAEYLERAASHALSLDAAAAATEFLERALRLPADDEDELRRRVLYADALVGAFRHQSAPEALAAAEGLAIKLGDDSAHAKVLRLRSDLHRLNGEFDLAGPPLEEAVALARRSGDEHEIAECLRSVGLLDFPAGRWKHSVEVLTEARERYRALGDTRGVAWCAGNLGNAYTYLLELDLAEKELTEALALFTERGDAEGVSFVLGSRSLARVIAGRPLSALEDLGATRSPQSDDRFSRRPATPGATAFTDAIRASADLLAGRVETALREAPGILEGQQLIRGWAAMIGTYVAGLASYLLGDLDRASEAVEEGQIIAARTEPIGRLMFTTLAILVALERGDIAKASAMSAEITASRGSSTAMGRYAAAKVLIAESRADEALALLNDSLGDRALGLISPAWTAALRAELLVALDDPRGPEAAREAVEGAGEDSIARAFALEALAEASRGAPSLDAVRERARILAGTLEWPAGRERLLTL